MAVAKQKPKVNSKFSVETWPIEKLVEYPNNPRDHDDAIEKMASAIREFGFKVPLVATSDGALVDGHLRLKAARRLGLLKVPVILADDLSPDQLKAFRLSVNVAAEWADWNPERLDIELAGLRAVDFDLEPFGLENIQVPEIEEIILPPPKAQRSKTTIFVSVKNEDVVKARKAIAVALDKAKISHNV